MSQIQDYQQAGPTRAIDLSIVVPIYNEVENIPPLIAALRYALEPTGRSYEILLVDDGSTDGSRRVLQRKALDDSRLRIVLLSRNFGQTAAMAAGFDLCRGSTIISMDGDLQNDPADIPVMIARLDEGYDVVCGWRKGRRDRALTRKLPSWIANRLISWLTGVNIHDTGCTLKVYRAWVVRRLHLYSDMHRFIPALAAGVGARIGEIPVRHHERKYGVSKYGIGRTLRVVLDMFVVRLIARFAAHPMRYFGIACLPLMAVGTVLGILGLIHLEPSPTGLFGYEVSLLELWDIFYMTSSLVVIMTALNLFVLGLLSELSVSVSDYYSHAGIDVDSRRGGSESRVVGVS